MELPLKSQQDSRVPLRKRDNHPRVTKEEVKTALTSGGKGDAAALIWDCPADILLSAYLFSLYSHFGEMKPSYYTKEKLSGIRERI